MADSNLDTRRRPEGRSGQFDFCSRSNEGRADLETFRIAVGDRLRRMSGSPVPTVRQLSRAGALFAACLGDVLLSPQEFGF
jgi:hypothetical protein